MRKKCFLPLLLFPVGFLAAQAQHPAKDSSFRKNFIGSSALMLANLFQKFKSFYQLNFGYWPVTTNLSPSFKQPENKRPGYFLFEPGFHIGYKF
jgi:hypothetical protein